MVGRSGLTAGSRTLTSRNLRLSYGTYWFSPLSKNARGPMRRPPVVHLVVGGSEYAGRLPFRAGPPVRLVVVTRTACRSGVGRASGEGWGA